MTTSRVEHLPAGAAEVALAWRDAASALLGAPASADSEVLRHLVLPLLVDPEPPAPTEPVQVNGGWVQADLIADDVELFERLAASLPEAGPEELSAAAQEYRLPVLPYRSEPWPIDSEAMARPGAFEVPAARFGGSLEGVNVLDLTAMWAGPLATRLLADAGASVTKVDPDCRPDGFRANTPLYEELNSGKDIIDLDLRVASDRQAFERRVAEADVLIESFSRRVMPNLDYSPGELRTLNPALTTISIVGFPLGCAEQDWLAYGTGIHAISGLGLTTDRAEPAPVGYPDPVTAYAVLARTLDVLGSGSHSEIALIDSAAAIHQASGDTGTAQGPAPRQSALRG